MVSKAHNEEARAVGAFAFSVNGVGTQSQSVNQNDTARHGSTRLRRDVRAGVVWRRCRQVGAETVGNRYVDVKCKRGSICGPLIVSTSSGLGRRDKAERRLAESAAKSHTLGYMAPAGRLESIDGGWSFAIDCWLQT
jgi:hypothetical protein